MVACVVPSIACAILDASIPGELTTTSSAAMTPLVRRGRHLDLGADLIGAVQDHSVGVRPSDTDAETIIKC